jgi:amino acid adenylation domain-containing protein
MRLPTTSDTRSSVRAGSRQCESLPGCNGKQRAYSRELCVPQLVAQQAIRNPCRPAVVGDALELTYRELDASANQLAHYLHSLCVRPNVQVGVCMPRSPLNIVAALAVLKTGGAYLPMDPSYPQDRLSFILRDAQAPVVLTDENVFDILPKGSWLPVMVDRDAEAIAKYPSDAPPAIAGPEALAYVIYTSGSTGTPKGVQVTHDNLLNLVFWHQNAFAVTPEDRATQLASFGFDAAVWELWPHLTAGAAVYVTPELIRNSPELLRDWLVSREITISFVPTPLAERLLLLDWPAHTQLRLLLTGADTLHHYPRTGLPFQLINNYGPTEATVVATSGVIPPRPQAERPAIGRPIDNTQIYICDESLNLVPAGEVGEIYIGGAGVARGYVNSPDLNSQKFVPDIFSDQPGARLYRTGDLARWLPDGQLAFLGRADNLIKIRGYRIEPSEIVSVLNTHPAIQASAVVARDDGNLRLLAYVVVTGRRPTSSELRSLVRRQLPDYMVPAGFIAMQALPLTPNGKIDRDALPAPDDANKLPDEDFAAPRTVLEEKVAAIVANLLGLGQVGVDDNFFLIGGHSLFGAQLIARIRDTFGVDLPLRSIFDSPTVAQLAEQVESLIVANVESMTEDEVERALGSPPSHEYAPPEAR